MPAFTLANRKTLSMALFGVLSLPPPEPNFSLIVLHQRIPSKKSLPTSTPVAPRESDVHRETISWFSWMKQSLLHACSVLLKSVLVHLPLWHRFLFHYAFGCSWSPCHCANAFANYHLLVVPFSFFAGSFLFFFSVLVLFCIPVFSFFSFFLFTFLSFTFLFPYPL